MHPVLQVITSVSHPSSHHRIVCIFCIRLQVVGSIGVYILARFIGGWLAEVISAVPWNKCISLGEERVRISRGRAVFDWDVCIRDWLVKVISAVPWNKCLSSGEERVWSSWWRAVFGWDARLARFIGDWLTEVISAVSWNKCLSSGEERVWSSWGQAVLPEGSEVVALQFHSRPSIYPPPTTQ